MINLEENKAYKEKYKRKGYMTSASFLMHEDCNLACSYCYEKENHHNKKMSNETIEKALDFLFGQASLAQSGGDDRMVSITLFGGEPTLNPEGIYHALEYGLKKSQETGTEYSVNMVTNATLMPDMLRKTFTDFMDKINISVQLSVDGPQDVQDKYRVTKNGNGSWGQVEKIIPEYMEIFKDRMEMLSLHGVLDQDSIKDLFRSYKYFIDMGMKRLWWIPAHNSEWTTDHVNEYDKQLGLIREHIVSELKKGRELSFINNYAPLDRCISNASSFGKPCGAGDGYCSINHEGEIHPCHQFYYYDQGEDGYELSIGNVNDGVDRDKQRVYIEYEAGDLSCPSTCDHYGCFRCIASNYEESGNMFEQIRGIYCTLMKIDKKHQDLLKKEVTKMGLLGDNEDNGQPIEGRDCLCVNRSGVSTTEVDFKQPEKKGHDCKDKTNDSIILDSLVGIIEALQMLQSDVDEIKSSKTSPIDINIGK